MASANQASGNGFNLLTLNLLQILYVNLGIKVIADKSQLYKYSKDWKKGWKLYWSKLNFNLISFCLSPVSQ